MGVMRPPFLVPPEELNLWDEDFEQQYDLWKGKAVANSNKSNSKEDYRQHIIDINNEFEMEEAFNKIEAGLAAIDTLIACKKRFPNYDLNEDLDQIYKTDKDTIYKEFIRFGVQLVENEVKEKEIDSTKEELKVEVKDEMYSEENPNLSQVGESLSDLHKEKRSNLMKSKRKSEKRKERLLKFHQKLVDLSGLPPSRLMLEMTTPRLSTAKEGLHRRKLDKEFEASAIPKVPEPKVDMNIQYSGTGVGDISKLETSQMLFSSPQPSQLCQPINGGESVWMSGGPWSEARPSFGVGMDGLGNVGGGWSEARPWVQQGGCPGWNNPQQGFGTGTNSTYLQQPTLCSSQQTCCGWSPPVCQNQTSPLPVGGKPAYCSSCLVFGKVFTVSPV